MGPSSQDGEDARGAPAHRKERHADGSPGTGPAPARSRSRTAARREPSQSGPLRGHPVGDGVAPITPFVGFPAMKCNDAGIRWSLRRPPCGVRSPPCPPRAGARAAARPAGRPVEPHGLVGPVERVRRNPANANLAGSPCRPRSRRPRAAGVRARRPGRRRVRERHEPERSRRRRRPLLHEERFRPAHPDPRRRRSPRPSPGRPPLPLGTRITALSGGFRRSIRLRAAHQLHRR